MTDDNTADDRFFEMAMLVPENTGLPFIIWISIRIENAIPSIEVQGNYSDRLSKNQLFSITIADEPEVIGDKGLLLEEDINRAREFVIRNKTVLLDYWNENDIDLISILSRISRV